MFTSTSASRICAGDSPPERFENRETEPISSDPRMSGKAYTACTPLCSDAFISAGQVVPLDVEKLSMRTGRRVANAAQAGPSPRSNCSSSNWAAIELLAPTVSDPNGAPSVHTAAALTGNACRKGLKLLERLSNERDSCSTAAPKVIRSVTRVDPNGAAPASCASCDLTITSCGIDLCGVACEKVKYPALKFGRASSRSRKSCP